MGVKKAGGTHRLRLAAKEVERQCARTCYSHVANRVPEELVEEVCSRSSPEQHANGWGQGVLYVEANRDIGMRLHAGDRQEGDVCMCGALKPCTAPGTQHNMN